MSLSRDIWGRGRQSEKQALGYFCCHLVKGIDLLYAFELDGASFISRLIKCGVLDIRKR